jgi:hypothetical protein
MPTEFEVGGKLYRIDRRLSAFQQQHVVRRIAPITAALVRVFEQSGKDLATALQPLAEEFARMPDADVEYVMKTALATVQRKEAKDRWARIWNEPAASLMYEDIDLLQMNEIVFHVLKDALGPFFQGLVQRGLLPAQPATSPA